MASNAERGSEANGADRRTVAEPVLHVDGAEGRGGDRLLGQDVQRVGRYAQPLDLAREHPLHGDGRVDQVCPVLREQDALGDFADLVAGAAHPLQAAGHGGRRLDLHHQVHGTHVDAELE